jgi:repressor LexA
MRDLTRQRLQQILDYVNGYIRENGYPPSVRDICGALGFASTSTVHIYLKRLEAEGLIQKSPTKPRALRVLPSGMMGGAQGSPLARSFASAYEDVVHVPVVGRVTAGAPILAVENVEYTFPVPSFFVNDDDVFMLRVQGDSMVNAGILDNDYVLVRQQPTAQNGDIVVALVGDSATVKTFYKERRRVRLQPQNDSYEPIILTKDCSIAGKVVGIFRKL